MRQINEISFTTRQLGVYYPGNQDPDPSRRRKEAKVFIRIDTKILSRRSLGAFSTLLLAGTLSATTITFSEIPATNDNCCYLTNEYATLGLSFVNNNGSVWGGNSNGNPGNWGLEGTNTPPFLGFNDLGPFGGYSASLVFSEPVSNFSLDVSRSK